MVVATAATTRTSNKTIALRYSNFFMYSPFLSVLANFKLGMIPLIGLKVKGNWAVGSTISVCKALRRRLRCRAFVSLKLLFLSVSTGEYNRAMSKNPIVNSFAASAYIILLVLMMNLGGKMAEDGDSLIAPIAAISLFTLSAAVMGYLFCFQPIQLYLDGKKKQGIKLFLNTVEIFGGITVLILLLTFFRVFS